MNENMEQTMAQGTGDAEGSDSGIYQKSIHSGTWYLASVLIQKVLSLGTFFVLARLLLPADYGIIAVVLLVTGILSQLTTISFGDALTQRKGEIERYLDPFWSFDLARSAVLALAIYLAGGWLSDFFHVPVAFAPMIRWSGLLLFISAFSNVRTIYLTKGLQFKKFFYRDAASQVAFSVASIGFALFVAPNAWALFVGYVFQDVIGVIISYMMYPAMPRFSSGFRRLYDLFGFAKWVYAHEFLEMLLAQIDKLVVGRLLSPTDLGAYSKAKDSASTATSILISLMQKVGFVAFARVQDQLDKVRSGFRKTVDVIMLTGVPVALLLALEGGAAVNVLLGPKWLIIVVPLKILAFGNLFYAFASLVAPVLSALGRPEIVFRMNALRTVLTVPLVFVGIGYGGVNGLAWAMTFVWAATLLYAIRAARPILNIPKTDFYPALLSGGGACAVMLGADLLLRWQRVEMETVGAQFIELACLGSLYFLAIWLFSRRMTHGPYQTLISILRESGVLQRNKKPPTLSR